MGNFGLILLSVNCSNRIFRMLRCLQSESAKSEVAFGQLQEIQESVRLALLNCLLDFAGKNDGLHAESVKF